MPAPSPTRTRFWPRKRPPHKTLINTFKKMATQANSKRELKKEMLKQHAELLKSGQMVIAEVTPRKKNGKEVYDYLAIQMREQLVPKELGGIAALRSNEFTDNLLISWINSVSEESHLENVKLGRLNDFDKKGNFEAKACEDLTLVVQETATLDPKRHIYLNRDSEVVVATPKYNPKTELYPTKGGEPIYRSVVPVLVADKVKDVVITADGSMDADDLATWKEEVLANCKEFVETLEKA